MTLLKPRYALVILIVDLAAATTSSSRFAAAAVLFLAGYTQTFEMRAIEPLPSRIVSFHIK